MDEFDAVDVLTEAIEGGEITERQVLIIRVGVRLGRMTYMPDQIDDFGFTDDEKVQVRAVARAVMLAAADILREARRLAIPARRRAMRLLRSFLSDEQRAQLDRARSFLVTGSAGGVYRLHPFGGGVDRVERHGSKWFAVRSFCLHDYAEDAPDRRRIPPGDLALQHLLLLSADEPAFVASANATERDLLWNGDWVRTLNARRREDAPELAQLESDVAAMRAADGEIAA